MENNVRRWKLVEADDGEFTSADILYFWVVMHLLLTENSALTGLSDAVLKLQPYMSKVYDAL